ncbi:glutamate receptor ionotropic, kainate glr-3-like [Schistocerca gregaria]|uniref:glutamate receptor ionotropic, kainate glr-3-like n=1 Tax=Schistocerca gregaria TaxID=7010 RepID=UPI00211E87E2|nr:glutamate receptor ionotropic, kainate glr-3-like [Schistocerca gregaria]
MSELFERRQSEFIWLLVLNDREPDLVLHDLHIEFNSNFYVAVPSVKGTHNILEAYRVGKGYPLVTNKYCTWHTSKQLTCANETIGMRRKDLMGYNMKLGVVEDWPDVTFFNKTHCGGYVCEVWEVLSQRINVTYSFEGSEIYGSRPVNGTWEGLMGQLQQDRVDIGLAPLMVTAERRSAVDFSLPLVSSRLVLLLREPKEELMWDEFLRPFDRYLWLGTTTVILLIWGVLRVQKRYRGGLRHHSDYSQTYSDALHVAGIFFMQGCGEGRDTQSRCSVRASLLVASTSAMVVYTAYCGALTASLAAHRLRMPFTDLKGLLIDGSYKLLLLYASGEMAMFDPLTDPPQPVGLILAPFAVIKVLHSLYRGRLGEENSSWSRQLLCSPDTVANKCLSVFGVPKKVNMLLV